MLLFYMHENEFVIVYIHENEFVIVLYMHDNECVIVIDGDCKSFSRFLIHL